MKNRSPHSRFPDSDPNASRLDTQEAADYIGVSVPYLKRERQLGRGPAFIRIGRRVVYDSRDLDKFLEQNRCTPQLAGAA